jgi:hypothetical protein
VLQFPERGTAEQHLQTLDQSPRHASARHKRLVVEVSRRNLIARTDIVVYGYGSKDSRAARRVSTDRTRAQSLDWRKIPWHTVFVGRTKSSQRLHPL